MFAHYYLFQKNTPAFTATMNFIVKQAKISLQEMAEF